MRGMSSSLPSMMIGVFRVRSFESGLDVGRELGNWGEVRVGVRRQTGDSRVRVGDPALPTVDFDARSFFARFSYDRLDNVNFPRDGQSFRTEWRGERTRLGSGRSSDLITSDWLLARSKPSSLASIIARIEVLRPWK